jgi:hypothetical protein
MREASSVVVNRSRSREEAERLVREFEQSRMGRKAFCEARGIAPHRLDYFRRRYGSGALQGVGQLVPVELVGSFPLRGSRLRVASSFCWQPGSKRMSMTGVWQSRPMPRPPNSVRKPNG